jgi:hypothetical protein
MDTAYLVGILLLLVVGFFGYQWWIAVAKRSQAKKAAAERFVAKLSEEPPTLPEVPGQSEADLRAKEPLQKNVPASREQPVTQDGQAPAQFDENLRHPEQLFHQPGPSVDGGNSNDVAAGRASQVSNAEGQAFRPEMAQNGGALVGGSVFAFDGMEPTGFSDF